jgi:hypothetical protein
VFQRLSSFTMPASGTAAMTPGFPTVTLAPSPAPAMAGPAIQRAEEPAAAATPSAASPTPAPAPAGQGSAGAFGTRPPDGELSNLAEWIYPLISYRIKGELRENRERLGLLTDQYRRW